MCANAELRAASVDALLRAAFALTHRMNAPATTNPDLRAQRDLIVAEIKRRTGE